MGRFAAIHDDMKKLWGDKNWAINEKSVELFVLTTIKDLPKTISKASKQVMLINTFNLLKLRPKIFLHKKQTSYHD